MTKYSIKQISELSGIKAHTIRIWEKRYNIPRSSRTETNIRTYDDEQLKYIINVAALLKNKFKISKVALLNSEQFNDALLKINTPSNRHEQSVNALVIAMIDLDEKHFNEIINTYTQEFGFFEVIKEIIYPFLNKIGVLWLSNSIHPAQEHFVTNLIRQKIIAAIEKIDSNYSDKTERYVLFLKDNEWHEIGLLIGYFLLKNAGKRVFYLGQNTPDEDLKKVIAVTNPKALVSICTHPLSTKRVEKFIALLDSMSIPTYISTSCTHLKYGIIKSKNLVYLNNMNDFIEKFNLNQ